MRSSNGTSSFLGIMCAVPESTAVDIQVHNVLILPTTKVYLHDVVFLTTLVNT